MRVLRHAVELLCIAAIVAFSLIGAPVLLAWYAAFPPRMETRPRRGGGYEHP